MENKITKFFTELMKDRKRAITIVVLIIALITSIWIKAKNTVDDVELQTALVQKGTIISSVTASGSIVSSNIENVTTQASGTVNQVYVSDGDTVYEGELIATIDLDVQGAQNHSSAYSSYISAASSLNTANNNYRSSQASLAVVYDEIQGNDDDESLETKATRTRAEVSNDNAYDSVKTTQARLTAASLAYRTSSPSITAPSAGTIKSVTVAEGMNIGSEETASGSRANQRIATIGNEGLPIATFNISEIEVSLIKPGQKATVTLDSISDKTFTGKVVSVDRVGSVTNNVTTYPIIIQLDTSSELILPNMTAVANVITDSKSDILIIPSAAITYQNDQTLVTIIKDEIEVNQKVEIGISNDTQVEIISGLNESDVVVTGSVSTGKTTEEESGGFIIPGSGGGGGRL